jgi:hypothetical protein
LAIALDRNPSLVYDLSADWIRLGLDLVVGELNLKPFHVFDIVESVKTPVEPMPNGRGLVFLFPHGESRCEMEANRTD